MPEDEPDRWRAAIVRIVQNVVSGGGFWGGVGSVLGRIWSLPNTALGVAFGLVGIPTQGFGFENGQIQFKGNLLQSGLAWIFTGGNTGAITLGDAGIFPRGLGPGTVTDIASGQTLGLEESFHSVQGRILGPLYLPANIVGGSLGVIRNGYWHGPANFMERGPHLVPPRVF